MIIKRNFVLTSAIVAGLAMSIAPAFAQSATGTERSPAGESRGASSTSAGTADGTKMTTSGASSTGAGTGDSKTTATGGQPGGRADKN